MYLIVDHSVTSIAQLVPLTAVGVIVARNAHLAGFRIEEDGTVAIGIHPGIDDLFRAAAAQAATRNG